MDPEIKQMIERLLSRNKYSENDHQDDNNLFLATAKYVRLIAENLGAAGESVDSVQRVLSSINPILNAYNPEMTTLKYETMDLSDGSVVGKTNTKIEEPIPGVRYDVPDFEAIFQKNIHGPGGLGGEFYFPKPQALKRRNPRAGKSIENPDVFFTREDFEYGYVEEDPLNIDSEFYVPFFLEDLRKAGRRFYFRAFLTSFRESIAPEWSQEKYYGRVDPVPIYKNTSRTFQVGFKIAALSPAGFSSMWKKVNNLSKLVYPTFENGVLAKSPVLRMRIGDVMADGSGQGLPGYISSPIELDYSQGPWEIVEYSALGPGEMELGRAPMIINVSFTFQVIHQKNPIIDSDYNFRRLVFRRIGDNGDVFREEVPQSERNPSTEVEDSSDVIVSPDAEQQIA